MDNVLLGVVIVYRGQSHFRGDNAGWRRNIHGAAKIGTVPCERLRKSQAVLAYKTWARTANFRVHQGAV